jgi:hypothetical protein
MKPQPRPGAGTRITVNSLGTSYSANSGGATYAHRFRPSLGPKGVQLSLGLVNGRPATIKGVPIGGGPGVPQPTLTLDPTVANANGESWVCVEVHPDDNGELPLDSPIEIVHTNQIRSLDPKLGRGELCMVLWKDKRPFRVVAIAMFHLRYARVLPPAGGGAVRHLFL